MSLLFGILLRGAAPRERLTDAGLIAADPTNSSSIVGNGNTPISGMRLNTDGQVQEASGTSSGALNYNDRGLWLENLQDASAYEARATSVSADAGGTFVGPQSFAAITVPVGWTWGKDADTGGSVTVTFNVEIREIADTSNILTYTGYSMTATETL